MKLYLVFLILILTVSVFPQLSHKGSLENIKRIKPTEFKADANCPQMPKRIADYLEKSNCTIPQSDYAERHHNAFQIQLAEEGQNDWAVLCSKDNFSSILIFWNGSTENVGELAKYADGDFLTTIDRSGKKGYRRSIGKDTKHGLFEVNKDLYGGIFDEISLWGIDESAPDRKHISYHFYKNRFLILTHFIQD